MKVYQIVDKNGLAVPCAYGFIFSERKAIKFINKSPFFINWALKNLSSYIEEFNTSEMQGKHRNAFKVLFKMGLIQLKQHSLKI